MISCPDSVMNNRHALHIAALVLTLESARPVRRVSLVPSAVRHVLAAVTANVILAQEYVLPAIPDFMDHGVIRRAKAAMILVVTRMGPAINALIQICMD